MCVCVCVLIYCQASFTTYACHRRLSVLLAVCNLRIVTCWWLQKCLFPCLLANNPSSVSSLASLTSTFPIKIRENYTEGMKQYKQNIGALQTKPVLLQCGCQCAHLSYNNYVSYDYEQLWHRWNLKSRQREGSVRLPHVHEKKKLRGACHLLWLRRTGVGVTAVVEI